MDERTIWIILTDRETLGFVETEIDSRDSNGCIKQTQTSFDPQGVNRLGICPRGTSHRQLLLQLPLDSAPSGRFCGPARESRQILTFARSNPIY